MKLFQIPRRPEELEEDVGTNLSVEDLASEDAANLPALCSGLLGQLKNEEPWAIDDQDNLNIVYSSIKHFKSLPGGLRSQLINALSTRAMDLSHAAQGAAAAVLDATTQHHIRNALLEYTFLLAWLLNSCSVTLAEEERDDTTSAAGGSKRGKKTTTSDTSARSTKAKGAKAAALPSSSWSFSGCTELLMSAAAALMEVNPLLLALTPPETQRQISLCVEMAITTLGHPLASKSVRARTGAYAILSAACTQPDIKESASRDLFNLARRDEHAVQWAVEAAVYDEQQRPGTCAVAEGLVLEFLSTHPLEYDEEKGNAASSVKQAAEVVARLADCAKLAPVVAGHLGRLSYYLHCNSTSVRSCLIQALGAVVRHCYLKQGEGEVIEAHEKARVLSKRKLLLMLRERLLDKAALTRVRCLKEISHLIQDGAFNLPDWPGVLEEVFGRLEDGSTMVQKEALKTLITMITCSPWDRLEPAVFKATVDHLEAELQRLHPRAAPSNGAAAAAAEEDDDVLAAGQRLVAQHRRRAKRNRAAGRNQVSAVEDGGDDGSEQEDQVDMEEGEGEKVKQEQEGPGPALGTEEQIEQILQPTQQTDAGFSADQLPYLIAKVKTGLEFARCIETQLPCVETALKTASVDVVQEAIELITLLRQRHMPGTQALLRTVITCVHSSEREVVDTVVDAFYNLYLKDSAEGRGSNPDQSTQALMDLLQGAQLQHTAALEAVIKRLCHPQSDTDYELSPSTVSAFVIVADNSIRGIRDVLKNPPPPVHPAGTDAAEDAEEPELAVAALRWKLHASLYYLAAIAPHMSQVLVPHYLPRVLAWLKTGLIELQDAWVVRHCCLILKAVSPTLRKHDSVNGGRAVQDACEACLGVMTCSLLGDTWYGPADAAMAALYSLHPRPHQVVATLLHSLYRAAVVPVVNSAGSEVTQLTAAGPTVTALGRVCFLAAHASVHQLALIDRTVKAIQTDRAAKQKAALEAQDQQVTSSGAVSSTTGAGKKGAKGAAAAAPVDDIALVAGSAANAADAELDSLRDQVDREVLEPGTVLHGLAQLTAQLCKPDNAEMLRESPVLCANLLLTLCKFMSVDWAYCKDNMELLVTWLRNTGLHSGARCNLIVAMADLATRWPNEVEPYQRCLYLPLTDSDLRVRRTCLNVLSHLTLNDVVKVKTCVVAVARCLVDPEPEMQDFALRFFTTLSQRTTNSGTAATGKNSNPIYSLLPDMLGSLARDPGFPKIMEALVPFVKDSKQCDGFKEKLCQRFESLHEDQSMSASEYTAAMEADRVRKRAEAAAAASAAAAEAQAAATEGEVQQGGSAEDDDAMDIDEPFREDQEVPAQEQVHVKEEAQPQAAPGPMPQAEAAQAAEQQEQGAAGAGRREISGVVAEWRALAYVLSQLGHSAQGSKAIMEKLSLYKHALGDTKVYAVFHRIGDHMRKTGDKNSDVRALAVKYLAEISEIHQTMRVGLADDEPEEVDGEGQGAAGGEAQAAEAGAPGEGAGATGMEGEEGPAASSGRRGAPAKPTISRQTATSKAKATSTRTSQRSKAAPAASASQPARGGSRTSGRSGKAARRPASDSDDDDIVSDTSSSDDEVVGPKTSSRGGAAVGGSRRSAGGVAGTKSTGQSKVAAAARSKVFKPVQGADVTSSSSEEDAGGGDRDQNSEEDEQPTASNQAQRLKQMRLSAGGGGSAGAGRTARAAVSRRRAVASVAEESEDGDEE